MLPRDLGDWMAVARDERAGWRRDGVPMDARRPLLLEALNRLYATREARERGAATQLDVAEPSTADLGRDHEHVGHVSLVGAGPGDPGLLTRKALSRAARAPTSCCTTRSSTTACLRSRGARSGSSSASAPAVTRCRRTRFTR